jgi:phosphoglycerate kinase
MHILIRLDLNVSIDNGVVKDNSRILACKQTIDHYKKQAKLCILSHLGRPDGITEQLSLKNLIPELEKAWDCQVVFSDNYDSDSIRSKLQGLQANQILLLENTRFYDWEKSCNQTVAAQIASSFDRFVFDAFACSHRKHLSTYALANHLPSQLGPLTKKEILNLQLSLAYPNPVLVMGGAKAKTKIKLIQHFIDQASQILLGGVMANTFLKAKGIAIGSSVCDDDLIPACQELLNKAADKIVLPSDFCCANSLTDQQTHNTAQVLDNQTIGDIGSQTIKNYTEILANSQAIIFNGPMGYTDNPNFCTGSESVLKAIAKSPKATLGGGDTIKLLNQFEIDPNSFSFVSTGGGAMLEFLAKDGRLEVLDFVQR